MLHFINVAFIFIKVISMLHLSMFMVAEKGHSKMCNSKHFHTVAQKGYSIMYLFKVVFCMIYQFRIFVHIYVGDSAILQLTYLFNFMFLRSYLEVTIGT